MRVLREPSAATLHGKAVAALFDIIKAMGLSFVPYLPKASGSLLPACACLSQRALRPHPPACPSAPLAAGFHPFPLLPLAPPLLQLCPSAPPPPPPLQVVPVLLQLTRGADDLARRVDMVRALTDLVVLMRQHVRRFLPDLLALVADFWGTAPAMLPHILQLLAELSREWVGAGPS